jgi:hypothetical protein
MCSLKIGFYPLPRRVSDYKRVSQGVFVNPAQGTRRLAELSPRKPPDDSGERCPSPQMVSGSGMSDLLLFYHIVLKERVGSFFESAN